MKGYVIEVCVSLAVATAISVGLYGGYVVGKKLYNKNK